MPSLLFANRRTRNLKCVCFVWWYPYTLYYMVVPL
nr:MAG TPA: hypothetical protein [Caudoviricetes sp.]